MDVEKLNYYQNAKQNFALKIRHLLNANKRKKQLEKFETQLTSLDQQLDKPVVDSNECNI